MLKQKFSPFLAYGVWVIMISILSAANSFAVDETPLPGAKALQEVEDKEKVLAHEISQNADEKRTPPLLSAPFSAKVAGASQSAWAIHLEKKVEFINSIDMKLMLIPPGEYEMGSLESAEENAAFGVRTGWKGSLPIVFEDEHPLHKVRLTKPFYLGTFEVKRGEFRKFVEETGYKTGVERNGGGGWGYDKTSKKTRSIAVSTG